MYTSLNDNSTTPLDKYGEQSLEILAWTHLNLAMQAFIHACMDADLDEQHKEHLSRLGFEGTIPQNDHDKKQLFAGEGFFSVSQTGKRVASYVLKINGLDQEGFSRIEKSIHHAYQDVKDNYPSHTLIDRTFTHIMDTLSVFKP